MPKLFFLCEIKAHSLMRLLFLLDPIFSFLLLCFLIYHLIILWEPFVIFALCLTILDFYISIAASVAYLVSPSLQTYTTHTFVSGKLNLRCLNIAVSLYLTSLSGFRAFGSQDEGFLIPCFVFYILYLLFSLLDLGILIEGKKLSKSLVPGDRMYYEWFDPQRRNVEKRDPKKGKKSFRKGDSGGENEDKRASTETNELLRTQSEYHDLAVERSRMVADDSEVVAEESYDASEEREQIEKSHKKVVEVSNLSFSL